MKQRQEFKTSELAVTHARENVKCDRVASAMDGCSLNNEGYYKGEIVFRIYRSFSKEMKQVYIVSFTHAAVEH